MELLQTQRALWCPALSRLLAQVSVHGNPWVKSGPLSGLVNKVLLNQAQTHSRTQHLQHICLSVLCIRQRAATETVWLTKSDVSLSHSSRTTRPNLTLNHLQGTREVKKGIRETSICLRLLSGIAILQGTRTVSGKQDSEH